MSESQIDISVVVPVYGCPGALPELHRRLTETLSPLVGDYEIILVDDRCPMGSWAGVQELALADPHVVGVRLARNFGQSRAITAGLDRARGTWSVVMDCDCQDPPEAIAQLYEKALEGYDVVFARRIGRKDSAVTLALSRTYYRVFSNLAETTIDPTIGNYSIVSTRARDAYLAMREQGRDYSLFMTWVGFEQATVDIEPEARFEGESSYSFGKKVALAVETITSHSTKPLMMAVKAGFAMSVLGIVVLIALIIRHFVDPDVSMGWPSIIASIFFVGGIVVSVMGVVGIYVGNTFVEAKHRPLYLVEDVVSSSGSAEDQR
ncbi:MAG: glycosyltransferase family 2 protein [Olsenella sp.]|nr:glycosyltransferase family 2 protein [Olsenella sp.]